MGCTAAKSGISIQFCHRDGSPDGQPIYGRYGNLTGQQQSILTAAVPPTQDEQDFKGSPEWITLVAVADTPERLETILQESSAVCIPCHTSCSSHRANVEMHIGGIRQSFHNRIVLASGPITSKPEDKILTIDVVHVKVLPANVTLTEIKRDDPDNPILAEFLGGSIAFQFLDQFK